ncbi:MAG TPA: FimV/HubP family polar landmark protein, partial [Woeseiaceae bacterium]
MLRKTLVAAMMLAFWGSAGAAGLGRINVMSSLGQPLRAEVELSATADELDSMVARMAPPDAFKRANMEYNALLGGVRMSIERRSPRPVIKLTSDRPINEPFVGLLLDLNWAGGRLLREYTFLLDPAEMPGQRPVAPAVAPISSPLQAEPARIDTAVAPVASMPTPVESRPAPVSPQAPAASADSYAVQRGDTLYAIAGRIKPGEVSQEQMMAALYRANSEAFVSGDVNRLRAGRILKVPQASEAQQISRTEARKIVFKAPNFDQYRQSVAASVASAPEREAGAQGASGKITPRVEGDAPASNQPRDQVRVTANEAPKAASRADDAATKARLDALTDELAARDRALKEANERRAQLEKNVQELQKLLELQNANMAKAQAAAQVAEAGKAGAAPAAEKKPDEAPVELAPEALPESPVSDAPLESVEQTSVEQQPAEVAPEIQPAPVVVDPEPRLDRTPPPMPEEDGLFRNLWALLGLGVIGVLAGYVLIKQRRKRAAAGSGNTLLTETSTISPNSVFGSAGGQVVD